MPEPVSPIQCLGKLQYTHSCRPESRSRRPLASLQATSIPSDVLLPRFCSHRHAHCGPRLRMASVRWHNRSHWLHQRTRQSDVSKTPCSRAPRQLREERRGRSRRATASLDQDEPTISATEPPTLAAGRHHLRQLQRRAFRLGAAVRKDWRRAPHPLPLWSSEPIRSLAGVDDCPCPLGD